MRPLFLLLLLASSLSAATARIATLLESGSRPVKIVCLGDSITGAYYHSGGIHAYPELLELALRRTYPQARVTVINAGVSGETTVNGLARFDRDVAARQPDLVTIMFGTNDLVKLPLEDFRRNLRELCNRARQTGAEVVVCTQNSVTDTEARPGTKLATYTEVIREIGHAEGIAVVDVHARFAAIRDRDPLAWTRLASDEIHPNFDGHLLIARLIAETIAGRELPPLVVPPPAPSLVHVRTRLTAGQPVKVLAMPPFDALIAPALTRRYPNAQIAVTLWRADGRSLAQIETAAKDIRGNGYDLVLIAVPADAGRELDDAEFHRRYTWILNWSINFAAPTWDTLVFPPSVLSATLNEEDRRQDDRARRVVASKDLSAIARRDAVAAPLPEWFERWVDATLATVPATP
jgi:lysophospholipase L1-like esterase